MVIAWLKVLRLKIRSHLRNDTLQSDLDRELDFHLQMLIRENLGNGMTPEGARKAALREFGNVEALKEESREHWGTLLVENLFSDFKLAFRLMAKTPSSTVLSVSALSLGIGLTVTIFSCLDNYLFKGLPFEKPHELMQVEWVPHGSGTQGSRLTLKDFFDVKSQQSSFETVVALENRTVNYQGEGLPIRSSSYWMSGDLFEMLKVKPFLGRSIERSDEGVGGDRVALISYGLWQSQFNGRADAIGSSILIEGEPKSVVGIMPNDFRFLRDNEVWIPQHRLPESVDLDVICGRLGVGIGWQKAERELNSIAFRLSAENASSKFQDGVFRVRPLHRASLGNATIRQVWMLQIFALLVLLVSCANVTNLLLAKFFLRRKELAARVALGATRKRIISQIMMETLVIVLVSGVGGILLSLAGIRLLWKFTSEFAPYWIAPFRFEPIYVLVVALTVLIACLLSGLIPALRVSRLNLSQYIRDDERTASDYKSGRMNRALVTVQVALSFALLMGAGLMIRGIRSLQSMEFPFDTRSLYSARVTLRDAHYFDRNSFFQFADSTNKCKRLEAHYYR